MDRWGGITIFREGEMWKEPGDSFTEYGGPGRQESGVQGRKFHGGGMLVKKWE